MAGADSFYQIQKRACVRLHQVGRFADLEGRQFANFPWAKRVVKYVMNRQNEDGGYTFCLGTESNAQDTYYGLAILDLLGVPFPKIERTAKWLRDFVPDNLYSHYYVAKALELCGEEQNSSLKDFLLSLPNIKGDFGTVDVYVEVASEFLLTFMMTELVNMVNVEINREKIINWLLKFKNRDGGFGVHGYSNLNSTYHAVASLANLGYSVKSLRETIRYVRACEKSSGGFTVVPHGSTPYMEHVYYGTSTLKLAGESLKYPEKTAKFVLKCQNLNGGFARSDLGISTFEDTFYAVNILQTIGK
ncbi:MAG: prenyltransferase/squalene oxidase repeat-containing protein [Candidatus Bathyarchaeia archaeon]